MRSRYTLLLIIICLCVRHGFAQEKASLTVTIKGFKSTAGTVKIQVQNEQKQEVFKKSDVLTAKTYTITIPGLAAGKYAVNVIHDKNNNNRLDTNGIGIPTEGWGCSNDARGFMGAPSFKSKLFTLSGNKTITINLVHY